MAVRLPGCVVVTVFVFPYKMNTKHFPLISSELKAPWTLLCLLAAKKTQECQFHWLAFMIVSIACNHPRFVQTALLPGTLQPPLGFLSLEFQPCRLEPECLGSNSS